MGYMDMNKDIKIDIKKYIKNRHLSIKVVSNSSREELIEEDNGLKLYLKAVPDKDKANKELIKFSLPSSL